VTQENGGPTWKRRREPCAICDGTNQTTRLCEECRNNEENADWQSQPRWEASGFEPDDFGAGTNRLPTTNQEKFYTPTAKTILRLAAEGKKLSDAAKEAKCSVDWAKKISAYWRKKFGWRVKHIAKRLRGNR
jgi:hypothetical protein